VGVQNRGQSNSKLFGSGAGRTDGFYRAVAGIGRERFWGRRERDSPLANALKATGPVGESDDAIRRRSTCHHPGRTRFRRRLAAFGAGLYNDLVIKRKETD
jgi:hypothetical protein